MASLFTLQEMDRVHKVLKPALGLAISSTSHELNSLCSDTTIQSLIPQSPSGVKLWMEEMCLSLLHSRENLPINTALISSLP